MTGLYMRPQRGSLKDAMEEAVTIHTGSEVTAFLSRHTPRGVQAKDLRWQLYDDEPDHRIGWDRTYIIGCDEGTVGFASFFVPDTLLSALILQNHEERP